MTIAAFRELVADRGMYMEAQVLEIIRWVALHELSQRLPGSRIFDHAQQRDKHLRQARLDGAID